MHNEVCQSTSYLFEKVCADNAASPAVLAMAVFAGETERKKKTDETTKRRKEREWKKQESIQ